MLAVVLFSMTSLHEQAGETAVLRIVHLWHKSSLSSSWLGGKKI